MKYAVPIFLLAALFAPIVVAADSDFPCDGKLFVVLKWDELYTKDGQKYVGYVSEDDNGDFKVRDIRTGLVRTFRKSEVKEVRRKATPEDELKRLVKENLGNPHKLLCIYIEATTRFNLYKESIASLQDVTASNPNEGLLQKLAELYIYVNEFDKALRVAEGLVKSNPKSARNLMLRGQALATLDKLELAEKDMAEATKLAPSDSDIVLANAEMLLRLGRADEARSIYRKEIDNPRNAHNPVPATGLAYLDLRAGEVGAAENGFKAALAMKPGHIKAMLGLAAVKIMNKQYDDAFGDCNQILNYETDNPDAYALQAFSKIFKGDYMTLINADKYINDSLKVKPNQPRLLLAWAVMLDRLAKYEELKSDKERNAQTLAQKRNDATAKMGEVLASDGADGFIQYFIGERRFREVEEAERVNAENPRKGQDAGVIAASLKKAEAAFDRAAKLAPHYAPAHAALGATALREKKMDAARAAFTKAAEVADPKSPDMADYIAGQGLSLLSRPDKFQEAKEFFNRALTLNSACVAAHCGRGYIANWERNKSLAMDSFSRALTADGDCAYAANALQLIYRQDDREMEYVRFAGPDWPKGWKPRMGNAAIKIGLENGRATFTGQQGQNMGNKLEISKDYMGAAGFERAEADLQCSPDSPVIYGLRVANGSGVAVAFELEFGKDESNEIKVRFRDANGINPSWAPLPNKPQWPKSGRVRLSIETDNLQQGETIFRLSINGKGEASVTTRYPSKPTRITVGAFLQAPPREMVNCSVNNIVVVKRGVAEQGPEIQADIKPITDPNAQPAQPDPEKKQ